MRKTFKIVLFCTVLFLLVSPLSVYAAVYENLDTLNITLNKTVVYPGEEVTITIDFGKSLGSFDIDIDFDDALFDFVSASRGATSISGSILSISFFDTVNPATTETVTFIAKPGITTSNPTEFLITLTGMANPTDTIRYNDTTPIVKDILVEPPYVDYKISVEYTEPILRNEEHPIDVRISSTMGRYYDHLRLIAEVTKPSGGTMKLLGIDSASVEHDVILSGWGDPTGFGLGGTVNVLYNFRGIFSEDGEYILTLKLIDKDAQDTVISSTTKTITVGNVITKKQEEIPKELPKTGINMYVYLLFSAFVILAVYRAVNKK